MAQWFFEFVPVRYRGDRRARPKPLTYAQLLEMAFSSCIRSSDVARQFRCSATFTRCVRLVVGAAYCEYQAQVLELMDCSAQQMVDLGMQFSAGCAIKWDETGKKVTLSAARAPQGATNAQRRSVWQVLVARFRVCLCRSDGAMASHWRSHPC